MTRFINFIFLILISICAICACNLPNKTNEANLKIIQDSSFVIHNMENLDFVDNLEWDFENLFLDALKLQKFQKLTNDQKLKYLHNNAKYEDGTGIDKEWIEMDWQAFFLGTRPKIGNLQPYIIKVYGTDYTGVFLVNLDQSGDLVSCFPIYSLENSGPEINEDTLIISRPKTKCKFDDNQILTSIQTGSCKPQNIDIQTFTVKQVNFKTTINQKGEITTMKLDSTEFTKKCELDYFQSY